MHDHPTSPPSRHSTTTKNRELEYSACVEYPRLKNPSLSLFYYARCLYPRNTHSSRPTPYSQPHFARGSAQYPLCSRQPTCQTNGFSSAELRGQPWFPHELAAQDPAKQKDTSMAKAKCPTVEQDVRTHDPLIGRCSCIQKTRLLVSTGRSRNRLRISRATQRLRSVDPLAGTEGRWGDERPCRTMDRVLPYILVWFYHSLPKYLEGLRSRSQGERTLPKKKKKKKKWQSKHSTWRSARWTAVCWEENG